MQALIGRRSMKMFGADGAPLHQQFIVP